MTLTAESHAGLTTGLTTGLYIDGAWIEAAETFEDLNPATGELLVEVASGSAQDIDSAVRAARSALEGAWAATPGAARGALLNKLADLVERDAAELARLEALDVGKPVGQPGMLDVPNAVGADVVAEWPVGRRGLGRADVSAEVVGHVRA